MKIIKIQLMDFLGLSAFKADKLGKLNRISGNNGVGKSAVLKGITEAFKSSGVDPYMIRDGAEKAEIFVELDNKVLIERRITPSANNVKVTVDGQPMDAPQKWLNGLFGLGSNLNPVDFFSPKPPKGMTPERYRRELLLSAMPFTLEFNRLIEILHDLGQVEIATIIGNAIAEKIDFSKHGLEALAQVQKIVYDRRWEIGQDVTRQKKSIEQDKLDLPATNGAEKFKTFDLSVATNDLATLKSQIEAHEGDKRTLEQMKSRKESKLTEISNTENSIERIKKQLIELQSSLSVQQKELAALQKEGEKLYDKVDAFVAPDTSDLERMISGYQEFQRLSIQLKGIERKQKLLEQSNEEYNALDDLHKALTNEVPRRILSEMKMPIKGLEIKGDEILINSVSIDKLSTSEQMRISVEIARALSGELKVICIDRYESLDAKSRKLFEAEARDDNFEYFFTVVNQDPDSDGALKLEVEEEIIPVEREQVTIPSKPKSVARKGF
jgi:DNA repair exonuclease SbcCD ATPase subunit